MAFLSHDMRQTATVIVLGLLVFPVMERAAHGEEASGTTTEAQVTPPLPPWPDHNGPPRYTGSDAVELRLRSSSETQPVTLLEETPQGWREVCTSPCRTFVDSKDAFGVAGNGIQPSVPFRLQTASTVVASPVSPPSWLFSYMGIFCLGHGGIFFGTGLALGNTQPGPMFTVFGGAEMAGGLPIAVIALW